MDEWHEVLTEVHKLAALTKVPIPKNMGRPTAGGMFQSQNFKLKLLARFLRKVNTAIRKDDHAEAKS